MRYAALFMGTILIPIAAQAAPSSGQAEYRDDEFLAHWDRAEGVSVIYRDSLRQSAPPGAVAAPKRDKDKSASKNVDSQPDPLTGQQRQVATSPGAAYTGYEVAQTESDVQDVRLLEMDHTLYVFGLVESGRIETYRSQTSGGTWSRGIPVRGPASSFDVSYVPGNTTYDFHVAYVSKKDHKIYVTGYDSNGRMTQTGEPLNILWAECYDVSIDWPHLAAAHVNYTTRDWDVSMWKDQGDCTYVHTGKTYGWLPDLCLFRRPSVSGQWVCMACMENGIENVRAYPYENGSWRGDEKVAPLGGVPRDNAMRIRMASWDDTWIVAWQYDSERGLVHFCDGGSPARGNQRIRETDDLRMVPGAQYPIAVAASPQGQYLVMPGFSEQMGIKSVDIYHSPIGTRHFLAPQKIDTGWTDLKCLAVTCLSLTYEPIILASKGRFMKLFAPAEPHLGATDPGQEQASQKIAGHDGPNPGDVVTNSIGIKLVWIPAGEFDMGSPSSEKGRDDDEGPVHRVKISKAFWMGQTEVTQAQYEALMDAAPWSGDTGIRQSDSDPAVCVSWNDAVEFCNKLSQLEGKTYRLPTEVEWEYACRAGTETQFSFGDSRHLSDYAWFAKFALDLSRDYAYPVGQKKPNPWSLYDMHGNVGEWCGDWYGKDYYSKSPSSDPQGPASGPSRVVRGGDFFNERWTCRSASRHGLVPVTRTGNLGFRIVLDLN